MGWGGKQRSGEGTPDDLKGSGGGNQWCGEVSRRVGRAVVQGGGKQHLKERRRKRWSREGANRSPICGLVSIKTSQPSTHTSTTEGFASKDGNVEARAAAATSESSPKDRIKAPDPLCGEGV